MPAVMYVIHAEFCGLWLPKGSRAGWLHPVLQPALEKLALLSCSCGAFLPGFASNTHCLWVELLG